ncbi:MAG: hypothetical protein ACOVQ7_15735 [Limnoraphis robusta]
MEFPPEITQALEVLEAYVKANRDDYSIVATIHNYIDFAAMSDEALERLTAFFDEHNQELGEEE